MVVGESPRPGEESGESCAQARELVRVASGQTVRRSFDLSTRRLRVTLVDREENPVPENVICLMRASPGLVWARLIDASGSFVIEGAPRTPLHVDVFLGLHDVRSLPPIHARPGERDTVVVAYEGSLSDGHVFDSTEATGGSARLGLPELAVPGLREALLMMREGDHWRIVVPPRMGFGRSGNNRLRKRDLIYDLRLIAVESAS